MYVNSFTDVLIRGQTGALVPAHTRGETAIVQGRLKHQIRIAICVQRMNPQVSHDACSGANSPMITEFGSEGHSVAEVLRTLQDTSDCSLRLVKRNAIRHLISALHEDEELQATMLQSCSTGMQNTSDVSAVIILASDPATMRPAALPESLALFQSVVQLCNLSNSDHGNATRNFTDNLMAHMTLPALVSHIHDVAATLPDATCAAAMADAHDTVLSWMVLLWQCCEASYGWHLALPDPLTSDQAADAVLHILLTASSSFKSAELKSMILRTLLLLWKGAPCSSILQAQPQMMASLINLVQDVSVPDASMADIAQMLNVESGALSCADAAESGTSARLQLMTAIAADAPGLVALGFEGSPGMSAHMAASSTRAAQRGAAGGKGECSMHAACRSLRVLLRSHLASGDASSAAFCAWTVAILENVPPHTQAAVLAAGVLDAVFDRISKQLSGRAHMRLETLHPEIAVILALAGHPSFPHHAMIGLPTLCEILQEALATDAQDTLSPVLAAIWAVCCSCRSKLTFSDASSLCGALLGALPDPGLNGGLRDTWMEPPADTVKSMVAALACVVLVLTGTTAATSVWQRLHASVLERLSAGLSALGHATLSTSFLVTDLFGELSWPQSSLNLAAASDAQSHEQAVSLLSLAAGITSHAVRAQGSGLLQSGLLQSAGEAVRPAAAGASAPQPGRLHPAVQSVGSQAGLGMVAAGFCMDVMLPAYAHACGHPDDRSGMDAVHEGLTTAVCTAITLFLEAAMEKSHAIFLHIDISMGSTPGCGVGVTGQGVQPSQGLPSADPPEVHPVATAAILLGWQCISHGLLMLLVERNDLTAKAAHRMLQLLLATALTGHVPSAGDTIGDLAAHQGLRHDDTRALWPAEAGPGGARPRLWVPMHTADLMRSFLRLQQPPDTSAPRRCSDSWLLFEASLLGSPLEQILLRGIGWHRLCAMTTGASVQSEPY
eukprot:jgi/Ulvmu1/10205/UM060_0005.1